jgi:hypothetical protein
MQEGFAEAVLGGRHKVFGRNLRPLSSAHVFFLQAVECKVFEDDGNATAEDLLLAAKVCSSPIRLVNGSYVPAWKPRATVRDLWRLAWSMVYPSRFKRECQAWVTYCEDYLMTPGKMETPGKTALPVSAPAVFSMVCMGIPLFGEERAWSMPFGLLSAVLEAKAEADGAEIRFERSEKELAEIEESLMEAEKAGAELLKQMEGSKHE